jgi:hypothetical protein
MREEYLFQTMERIRDRLLLLVEKCPIEQRNVIPTGFNNHIFWHIGHILTVTDGMVFVRSAEASRIPESYRSFFGNGTKPADWIDTPPTWETIITQLKEQPQAVRDAFSGRLEQAVTENYAKAENVGEMLINNLTHDSNHAGSIHAMLKVLLNQ